MSAPADHSRRRLPVVGNLPGANYFNDRLNDAIGMLSALPEIVVALRAIEAHIEHVDDEVTKMRAGVDRLGDQVAEMAGELGDLGSGINEVSAAVGRLEPHVSDLSRLARPLRRRRRSDLGAAPYSRNGPGLDDESDGSGGLELPPGA